MPDSDPLSIRFRRFWTGFEPHEFFVPFLAQVSGRAVRVVAEPGADVDIDIESVFASAPARPWSRLRRASPRPG